MVCVLTAYATDVYQNLHILWWNHTLCLCAIAEYIVSCATRRLYTTVETVVYIRVAILHKINVVLHMSYTTFVHVCRV